MSFPLQYEQAQDRDEESAWDSTVEEDESPRKVENKVLNDKVVSRKKDEVRLCAIAVSRLPHSHRFIVHHYCTFQQIVSLCNATAYFVSDFYILLRLPLYLYMFGFISCKLIYVFLVIS